MSVPTTYQVETDPAQLWSSAVTGDPHLGAGAATVDYCDTTAYTPVDRDIDSAVRGVDDPGVTNIFGSYDLGADERLPGPAPDAIFQSGFGT